jgi:putative sporulation protein YyaC
MRSILKVIMTSYKKTYNRRTEYFNPNMENSSVKLGKAIISMIQEANAEERDMILICIGTDRATGDALGPLIGDYVLNHNTCYNVAGTLQYPVHALNIKETIKNIYMDFDNPFVIAIDASLGLQKDLGKITISNFHIFPGKGVNKKLPAIGDISITGIVNIQLNIWPTVSVKHCSMPIIICRLPYKS